MWVGGSTQNEFLLFFLEALYRVTLLLSVALGV
jgi:hypothetical protein